MVVVIEENAPSYIQTYLGDVEVEEVNRVEIAKHILELVLSGSPVIGIYKEAYSEYNELYEDIKLQGGNPYLYEAIDLLYLVKLPREITGLIVKSKKVAIEASQPWKMLYRITTRKAVTRRALLFKPVTSIRDYVPAPILVNHTACAEATKCTLCIDFCQEKALFGKPPTVDPSKCTGCGICAKLCPFDTLIMPTWSTLRIARELDIIREKYNGPLKVLILDRKHVSHLANIIEIKNITPFIVEIVENLEWIDAKSLIKALSYGAESVIYDPTRVINDRDIALIAKIAYTIDDLAKLIAGEKQLPASMSPEKYHLSIINIGINRLDTTTPVLGIAKVNEKCTLCDACVTNCPTNALKKKIIEENDKVVLTFNHEKCVGCKICEKVCPHDAISIKWGIDTQLYGREETLFQDSLIRCQLCGKPLGPKSMLKEIEDKMREKGIPESVIRTIYLCDDCKRKIFKPK